ncbi:hypothetical protein ACS6XI_09050 [Porphyromonas endodontalis]|uniref:hypothetical protein n=1 Tax=Porphyromonas endodontalis TaxID=28124 RepID=UPI003FA7E890
MKTLIGMRTLTLLLLSVLSAGLIIGCKKRSKKTADEEANKVTTECHYKNLKTVVDSTYSDWHIIIQEADTDVKIEGYDEFDKKVLVTISKNGEVLFDKGEFTKTSLHSSLDNHFQLSGAYLEQITNTTVYLSLGLLFRKRTKVLLHTCLFEGWPLQEVFTPFGYGRIGLYRGLLHHVHA